MWKQEIYRVWSVSVRKVISVMSREEGVSRRDYLRIVGGGIVGLAAGTAIGYMIPREATVKPTRKVLLIFSYSPDHPWVMAETTGVREVLWDKGFLIEEFYMDTKRHTSSEWIDKVTEEAVEKIKQLTPDLVIVFDDNATNYVAKKFVGQTLPFVFCGVNRKPKDYGLPASNITGVAEVHHYVECVNLLKRIVPNVNKVAMVMDDGATSQGFLEYMREISLPVEIAEVYTTNDFDAWKAEINELQSEVDAIGLFTYHTVKQGEAEESLPPEQVLGWTLQNNTLPEFAFFDFTIKGGALCGVTLPGSEQGRAAAEIALEIMNGTRPGDIPIMTPERTVPMVNIKRAQQLKLNVPASVLEEVEVVQ